MYVSYCSLCYSYWIWKVVPSLIFIMLPSQCWFTYCVWLMCSMFILISNKPSILVYIDLYDLLALGIKTQCNSDYIIVTLHWVSKDFYPISAAMGIWFEIAISMCTKINLYDFMSFIFNHLKVRKKEQENQREY